MITQFCLKDFDLSAADLMVDLDGSSIHFTNQYSYLSNSSQNYGVNGLQLRGTTRDGRPFEANITFSDGPVVNRPIIMDGPTVKLSAVMLLTQQPGVLAALKQPKPYLILIGANSPSTTIFIQA